MSRIISSDHCSKFQEMNRVSVPGSPRSHYSPRLLNGHAEPMPERHQRFGLVAIDLLIEVLFMEKDLFLQVFRSRPVGHRIPNCSCTTPENLPDRYSTKDGEF